MARGVHLEQAGEDTKMKTKLLALIALAGGSLFAQSRFSVGVAIGSGPGPAYYRPAPVAVPAYRPGFVWVEGHSIRTRFGREWIPGHWVRRAAFNPYRAYSYDRDYPRYEYPRYR
jgi:WXXGXW repeat (2 copies)